MIIRHRRFSIRQNRYDNWYGYAGGRRVIAFGNNSHSQDAEQQAREWLDKQVKAATPPIVLDFVKHVGRWQSIKFGSTARINAMNKAASCLTVMTAAARRQAMASVTLSNTQEERLMEAYAVALNPKHYDF